MIVGIHKKYDNLHSSYQIKKYEKENTKRRSILKDQNVHTFHIWLRECGNIKHNILPHIIFTI